MSGYIPINADPVAMLLQLVNRNNATSFTADHVDFGLPEDVSQTESENTKVKMIATVGSGYSGEIDIYYDRLSLEEFFLQINEGKAGRLDTFDGLVTVHEVMNALADKYGVVIDKTDILNQPLSQLYDEEGIVVSVRENSLLWYEGAYVYLTPETTDIDSVIEVEEFDGFALEEPNQEIVCDVDYTVTEGEASRVEAQTGLLTLNNAGASEPLAIEISVDKFLETPDDFNTGSRQLFVSVGDAPVPNRDDYAESAWARNGIAFVGPSPVDDTPDTVITAVGFVLDEPNPPVWAVTTHDNSHLGDIGIDGAGNLTIENNGLDLPQSPFVMVEGLRSPPTAQWSPGLSFFIANTGGSVFGGNGSIDADKITSARLVVVAAPGSVLHVVSSADKIRALIPQAFFSEMEYPEDGYYVTDWCGNTYEDEGGGEPPLTEDEIEYYNWEGLVDGDGLEQMTLYGALSETKPRTNSSLVTNDAGPFKERGVPAGYYTDPSVMARPIKEELDMLNVAGYLNVTSYAAGGLDEAGTFPDREYETGVNFERFPSGVEPGSPVESASLRVVRKSDGLWFVFKEGETVVKETQISSYPGDHATVNAVYVVSPTGGLGNPQPPEESAVTMQVHIRALMSEYEEIWNVHNFLWRDGNTDGSPDLPFFKEMVVTSEAEYREMAPSPAPLSTYYGCIVSCRPEPAMAPGDSGYDEAVSFYTNIPILDQAAFNANWRYADLEAAKSGSQALYMSRRATSGFLPKHWGIVSEVTPNNTDGSRDTSDTYSWIDGTPIPTINVSDMPAEDVNAFVATAQELEDHVNNVLLPYVQAEIDSWATDIYGVEKSNGEILWRAQVSAQALYRVGSKDGTSTYEDFTDAAAAWAAYMDGAQSVPDTAPDGQNAPSISVRLFHYDVLEGTTQNASAFWSESGESGEIGYEEPRAYVRTNPFQIDTVYS